MGGHSRKETKTESWIKRQGENERKTEREIQGEKRGNRDKVKREKENKETKRERQRIGSEREKREKNGKSAVIPAKLDGGNRLCRQYSSPVRKLASYGAESVTGQSDTYRCHPSR